MRTHRSLNIFAAIIAALLLAFLLLPWQGWVQQKLIAAIEKKGIAPVSLSVSSIGLHGLVVKDVSLGEPPLKLAELTVGYAPRALLRGEIEDVELSGLTLNATQGDTGWSITGLEALMQPKATSEPTKLPVSSAALGAMVPLKRVSLVGSTLHAAGKGWQADVPVKAMLHLTAPSSITLESTAITANFGENGVTTGTLKAALALDEEKQQWAGTWEVEGITLTSESIALPKLNASGNLVVATDVMAASGNVLSADKSHHAAFKVNYALNDPKQSVATISQAAMPWGGGNIAVNKVVVPLSGKQSITLNLAVNQIAIDTLMQALTGNRATATGVVSGTLPITILPNGELRFGKGALTADQPGTIALAPEVIPGDNQQVALVREVLKNLHYTLLSLELDMAPDGKLSAMLAVEGQNPDVEKGRAVKLKVHLNGDLLDLIRQNVNLMTDPKTFIEQGTHDTH